MMTPDSTSYQPDLATLAGMAYMLGSHSQPESDPNPYLHLSISLQERVDFRHTCVIIEI